MNKLEQILKHIDVSYSYELAKRMESFKCNSVLGYRTAGSDAEHQTGNMLFQEMKALGLSDVSKDMIAVDSWDFKKAKMTYKDAQGMNHQFELGGYQTDFHTNGVKRYSLVYLKKGLANDYAKVDVTGKLVLIDINQRNEWWINYPVYQAYIKGAAALIAVQEGGYGEVHETALNAQDIAGPAYAAAFSMSRADAAILKEALEVESEITVTFDADSTVTPNGTSYNIVGKIPGRCEDSAILLTAHYDSYFSGFQDDNCAIGMMLGIARAIIKSGYFPNKTLIFCAMAAEEWGISNTKYDWSTGAYQQVFFIHPEWHGMVCANINFELPAHAHGDKALIRCVYEYSDFLKSIIKKIKTPANVFPDGLGVVSPIQTWSDDFSIAIAGIPSMVNDFSDGSFMKTNYHSQFDNEDFYDESVYEYHHNLYTGLTLAFDQTAIAPLNFSNLFLHMKKSLDQGILSEASIDYSSVILLLTELTSLSKLLYHRIKKVNKQYLSYLMRNEWEKATHLRAQYRTFEKKLLDLFQLEQDSFVALNWHDDVLFSHEVIQDNLYELSKAIKHLESGDLRGSLEALYLIDNNRYAFLFDKEVFSYFTNYVLHQSSDRLMWGAGRIINHEDLYDLVSSIRKKNRLKESNVTAELEQLKEVKKKQLKLLKHTIELEKKQLKELKKIIKQLLKF